MFEIVMLIAACIAMGKIADAEGRSAFIWVIITLAICLASLFFVPLPLLRIFIAFMVAFIAMMVAKAMGGR